jgi:hypothetical protein
MGAEAASKAALIRTTSNSGVPSVIKQTDPVIQSLSPERVSGRLPSVLARGLPAPLPATGQTFDSAKAFPLPESHPEPAAA